MQKGTVAAYQAEFEDLSNRVSGIPPAVLLSCFIFDLLPEIRREVQAHQPLTLSQAVGLARLQEEKLTDHRPPPPPPPHRPRPPPLTHTPSPSNPPSLRPNPLPPFLTTLPRPQPPPPPFKRLTSDEIASRRERGLCFSCNEKYHRGHRCASRVFLLLAEDKDNPNPPLIEPLDHKPEPAPDPPDTHDPYPAQLSLNSLAGHLAPETLRFVATISDSDVVLLVDGGSTHNFIQLQLVTQLGLLPISTSPLRVMVGNGQQLECNSMCSVVPITIQTTTFHVDLYVLPISSANVVLGVHWLKSLGPVLTDCNHLTMQFFYEGNLIHLQGDMDAALSSLSSLQFRRLSRKNRDGLYYHITLLSSVDTTTQDLPPSIHTLLAKYDTLFQPPQTLPPTRDTDHHIHLLPQAPLVNVRPYRYPITKNRRLSLRWIRCCKRAFFSPALAFFPLLFGWLRSRMDHGGFASITGH